MKFTAMLIGLALTTTAFAHEDGGCEAFTWNLTAELAAMRTTATPIQAAPAVSSAGRLQIGKHYSLTLLPQSEVTFAKPPARPPRADKPMAGLVRFTPPIAGKYRIGLTTSHWIDVLDGDTAIDSSAHQGQKNCELLHKVVEFELAAGKSLTLQISGQDAATIDLVISPA